MQARCGKPPGVESPASVVTSRPQRLIGIAARFDDDMSKIPVRLQRLLRCSLVADRSSPLGREAVADCTPTSQADPEGAWTRGGDTRRDEAPEVAWTPPELSISIEREARRLRPHHQQTPPESHLRGLRVATPVLLDDGRLCLDQCPEVPTESSSGTLRLNTPDAGASWIRATCAVEWFPRSDRHLVIDNHPTAHSSCETNMARRRLSVRGP